MSGESSNNSNMINFTDTIYTNLNATLNKKLDSPENENVICILCLEVAEDYISVFEQNIYAAFRVLFNGMILQITKNPQICTDCESCLLKFWQFRNDCVLLNKYLFKYWDLTKTKHSDKVDLYEFKKCKEANNNIYQRVVKNYIEKSSEDDTEKEVILQSSVANLNKDKNLRNVYSRGNKRKFLIEEVPVEQVKKGSGLKLPETVTETGNEIRTYRPLNVVSITGPTSSIDNEPVKILNSSGMSVEDCGGLKPSETVTKTGNEIRTYRPLKVVSMTFNKKNSPTSSQKVIEHNPAKKADSPNKNKTHEQSQKFKNYDKPFCAKINKKPQESLLKPLLSDRILRSRTKKDAIEELPTMDDFVEAYGEMEENTEYTKDEIDIDVKVKVEPLDDYTGGEVFVGLEDFGIKKEILLNEDIKIEDCKLENSSEETITADENDSDSNSTSNFQLRKVETNQGNVKYLGTKNMNEHTCRFIPFRYLYNDLGQYQEDHDYILSPYSKTNTFSATPENKRVICNICNLAEKIEKYELHMNMKHDVQNIFVCSICSVSKQIKKPHTVKI